MEAYDSGPEKCALMLIKHQAVTGKWPLGLCECSHAQFISGCGDQSFEISFCILFEK
jgi:hypothetical protein